MTARDRFSAEAQRHLDGERVEGLTPRDTDEADRFVHAMLRYAGGLEMPGQEVDARVMAAVLAKRRVRKPRSFWHWFIQPSQLHVRPALLAAASVALVAAGAAVVSLLPRAAQPARIDAAATVLVRFELRAPTAARVSLAGSFNDWNADRIELERNQATGLWTGTIPLVPGRYEYSFVIDDELWIPDPSAHAQVDDGFGQVNSVIVVGPRGVVRS